MQQTCLEQKFASQENVYTISLVSGGAFVGIEDSISPFGYKKGEGIDAGSGEVDWICNRDRERTDAIFDTLGPIDGKISGAGEKVELFLMRYLANT